MAEIVEDSNFNRSITGGADSSISNRTPPQDTVEVIVRTIGPTRPSRLLTPSTIKVQKPFFFFVFQINRLKFFYAESSMHVMITHFLAFISLLILFIRCAICGSWLQRVIDCRLGIWSLFYGEKFWMTVKMKMMYMCGSIMAVYLRYSADCVILRSVVSFAYELPFYLLGLQ